MTPVEAIISHFEAQERAYREAAKQVEAKSIKEYTTGKADGYQEAADFLKGLQKLFN